MATKYICDFCGKAAIKSAETAIEIQNPYAVGPKDGPPPLIVTKALFNFRNHPQGYGGPPDLCAACRANLIAELLEKAERLAGLKADAQAS